jgi:hypothetical protein
MPALKKYRYDKKGQLGKVHLIDLLIYFDLFLQSPVVQKYQHKLQITILL